MSLKLDRWSRGDNIVKTRLAAGEMADLCLYNSGSLLNALNPAEYFIDISNEDFIDKLDETYKSTVTVEELLTVYQYLQHKLVLSFITSHYMKI